jgi:hypothetical protein
MPIRPGRPPTPQSDVADVSWLPSFLLRGGTKTGEEIRNMARGLHGEGANPEEIYRETGKHVHPTEETGLAYGPGGDWQFQIPDNKMELTPQAMAWLQSRTGELGGSTPVMNLDEAMQHDLLYDRVPGMRKVKTELNQLEEGETTLPGGEYTEPHGASSDPMGRIKAYGKAGVEPPDRSERSLRGILAHEINHPLQWKYDMPRGGSPDSPGLDKFYNKQMVPQAAEMRKALIDHYKQFVKRDPENPKAFDLWRQTYPEKAQLLDEASRVGGFNSSLPGAMQHKKLLPYDQYISLAGEQRAMQGARQSSMSAEELRNDPPMKFHPYGNSWKGKTGIPEPLQIVRRGDTYSRADLPYFKKGY